MVDFDNQFNLCKSVSIFWVVCFFYQKLTVSLPWLIFGGVCFLQKKTILLCALCVSVANKRSGVGSFIKGLTINI